MAPPVSTQVAVPGLFYQSQRAYPNLSQFREHCVLFQQESWIYGNWRFQANQAHFRESEGKAKSLQHRGVLGLFLQDSVGCGDHGALHHHYMRGKFRGRPRTFSRACFPEVGWDGIGRSQQAVLRTVQFLDDGFEWWHDAFGEK